MDHRQFGGYGGPPPAHSRARLPHTGIQHMPHHMMQGMGPRVGPIPGAISSVKPVIGGMRGMPPRMGVTPLSHQPTHHQQQHLPPTQNLPASLENTPAAGVQNLTKPTNILPSQPTVPSQTAVNQPNHVAAPLKPADSPAPVAATPLLKPTESSAPPTVAEPVKAVDHSVPPVALTVDV